MSLQKMNAILFREWGKLGGPISKAKLAFWAAVFSVISVSANAITLNEFVNEEGCRMVEENWPKAWSCGIEVDGVDSLLILNDVKECKKYSSWDFVKANKYWDNIVLSKCPGMNK